MTWYWSFIVLGTAAPLIVGGVTGVWLRRRFLVVTVHGPSMLPALRDGDRVLVRRCAGHDVSRGQVVIVDGRLLPWPDGVIWQPRGAKAARVVKRVAATAGERLPEGVAAVGPFVPPGTLALLGDNPAASDDSRRYGCVDNAAVMGVVVRRVGGGAAAAVTSSAEGLGAGRGVRRQATKQG